MKKKLNIEKAVEFLLFENFNRAKVTGTSGGKTMNSYYSGLGLYADENLSEAENTAYLQGLHKQSAVVYFGEVLQELEKAETMHPDWPVDIVYQASIMMEEAGEALREANNLEPSIDGRNSDTRAFRAEVIQTAAMCFRILKNL